MRTLWQRPLLENRRMLLLLVLVAAGLFFGSVLFILSRVPQN